ncbi:hypothetical protein OG474_24585 [Kribbella sp. NBC_01505]|uniref:hypothetical protein n=1 Tax=Kribbella sp. NBC_01505 TaxID=2903580 RepID=UPI0038702B16
MLLSTALVCSLAACGGKDDKSSDLPTLTPEPTTSSSTPSTTPSAPTPTAEPTQVVTKYRDLTLVFNQPAKVDANARQALKAYKLFQQAFRSTLGTDTLDPTLDTVAGPTVVAYVKDVLKNQTKDGDRLGGTLTVTAAVERAGAGAVLIGGCFDQSKSYGIHSNGTHFGNDVVKKKPRLAIAAIASSSGGGWRITDYRLESTPC